MLKEVNSILHVEGDNYQSICLKGVNRKIASATYNLKHWQYMGKTKKTQTEKKGVKQWNKENILYPGTVTNSK